MAAGKMGFPILWGLLFTQWEPLCSFLSFGDPEAPCHSHQLSLLLAVSSPHFLVISGHSTSGAAESLAGEEGLPPQDDEAVTRPQYLSLRSCGFAPLLVFRDWFCVGEVLSVCTPSGRIVILCLFTWENLVCSQVCDVRN